MDRGNKLGAYEVIDKLGQGGMATVYKAHQPNLDRFVAIKVMHPALNEDEAFINRFEREARLIARLEHPSIVPVYDYDYQGEAPYLVMRFIEGETLKARKKRSRPPLDEIVEIVESVGEGLAYAHRMGVLHRDIKPSNIMIDPDGKVYIMDFGLARLVGVSESTLSQDMMLGTPQYVSPEQAMGDKQIDERTDIYSLGVIIYELMVGRVPYQADTPFAIVHDHIFTPLPKPSIVNPEIPLEVEAFLMKVLAKKREERFGSAEDMIAAFKQAVEEAGAEAIEAASVVEPLPMEEVRRLQGLEPAPKPGSLSDARSDEPVGTTSRIVKRTVTKRVVRTNNPQAWAVLGLLLLLATLIAGGLYVGQVIDSEIDRTMDEISIRIEPDASTLYY